MVGGLGGRPGSNSRGFNTHLGRWPSLCFHSSLKSVLMCTCTASRRRVHGVSRESLLVLCCLNKETASRCSNGKVNPGVTNSRGGGGRGGGTNRAASGTRVPPVQKSDPFCRTSSVVARSREGQQGKEQIQEGSSSHRRTTLCLVTTTTPNGKNMHAQPPRRVSS
jgi:hypothetical protein